MGLPATRDGLPDLPCSHCGRQARDGRGGFEEDAAGNFWVYCRACDAWTSHPPTPDEDTPR